jgi:hypothetical protein
LLLLITPIRAKKNYLYKKLIPVIKRIQAKRFYLIKLPNSNPSAISISSLMIKIHKSIKLAVSFVVVMITVKIDKTKSLAFYD